MAKKESKKKPVRKLTFQKQSPRQSSKVKTLATTYDAVAGDAQERISYTVSYPTDRIAPDTDPKGIAKELSDAITSALSGRLISKRPE